MVRESDNKHFIKIIRYILVFGIGGFQRIQNK